MTTRKLLIVMVAANLLIVGLVTVMFQTGGLLAGSAPRSAGDGSTTHDPSLFPVVPQTMNYQGILKDSLEDPLNGRYDLTFAIYRWDSGLGWVSDWSETQSGVDVTDGLFNVELGSVNPLNGGIFEGVWSLGSGALELGVAVDGGTELSPRAPLVTVPYAYRAEYVNRFPSPHYDSGWQTIANDEFKTFTHNLGGSVDNYIVDLQFKKDDGTIHQAYYGMDYDDAGLIFGAYWWDLTTTQIQVRRGFNDPIVPNVRVRIWRID
jgi:hypothetical protein